VISQSKNADITPPPNALLKFSNYELVIVIELENIEIAPPLLSVAVPFLKVELLILRSVSVETCKNVPNLDSWSWNYEFSTIIVEEIAKIAALSPSAVFEWISVSLISSCDPIKFIVDVPLEILLYIFDLFLIWDFTYDPIIKAIEAFLLHVFS